jgi:hypothetical protein
MSVSMRIALNQRVARWVILARPDLRSIKLELALPAYAMKAQKPESAPDITS